MTDETRAAFVELDKFISQSSSEALQKLGIESYSINTSSPTYDKGWNDGFHRCLAELKRAAVQTQELRSVTKKEIE